MANTQFSKSLKFVSSIILAVLYTYLPKYKMYYTPALRIIFFMVVPIIGLLNNEIIDEKLNGLQQTNTQLFEGNN